VSGNSTRLGGWAPIQFSDIDVTGTWRISYVTDLAVFTDDEMLVQDGASLLVRERSGWLDPVTRNFQASAFTLSQLFFCEIGSQITGTFSADGETFEGNALFVVEHQTLQQAAWTARGRPPECASTPHRTAATASSTPARSATRESPAAGAATSTAS
jgi:hypothetical protein